MTAATGPKISSAAARSSLRTGQRTVGANQKPGPSGASPRMATRDSSSTKDATVSRWSAEMSGPMSVASSSGSPTRIPRTAGSSRSRKASSAERSTRIRERAQQSCPALPNTAPGAAAAAASRSASANTTFALLPPSSSVTRLIVPAAPAAIERPTSVEPVNAILATSGCSTSRWPTVRPAPTTTLTTPAGMPASVAIRSNASAVSGVSSAGLRTTVLPAASAGASFHDAMTSGKFQGVMSATTPSGSRTVIARPPAIGIVSPLGRSGAPA
jgi:hypothetical protein